MKLPKNKKVLEDCIYVLKVTKNMDYVDATRYLFSNDLNTLELIDCMKMYFKRELIAPLNEKLNELYSKNDMIDDFDTDDFQTYIDDIMSDENDFVDDLDEDNLETYIDNIVSSENNIIDDLEIYADNIIKNGFKKGNFESYRYILDEIICDDSYDLYKIISSKIEKDKENLNSDFEEFPEPLYKDIEQDDMNPLQYRLYTMGSNFETEYNAFVDFINTKEKNYDEITKEELQLIKVVLCSTMDKLLKTCAIYTQNEELINAPNILYKADEILTSWPIPEELRNKFLSNKEEFMNIILGKYSKKYIMEKTFENFGEYFIELSCSLGKLINS